MKLKDLCFEIIWKCPNNCLFCSSNSDIDKDKIISYEVFKNTIDYLINSGGIEEISISGGEPLLHKDLLKMIKYCKDKGIRVVLFTSGIKRHIKVNNKEIEEYKKELENRYKSYLNEGMELDKWNKLIDKLMKNYIDYNNKEFDSLYSDDIKLLESIGLDKIVFDFQAWDKEVYNQIMGTNNYYELVLKSLICASNSKLEVDVHYIPTKINYKQLPDIIEMLNIAEINNLSILNFVPQGRGYNNKNKLLLSEEEFIEFLNIYNNQKDIFKGNIRVGIPLQGNDQHKCNAGISKMVIKYDGLVLPCPAFKEYDINLLNKLGIKTPNIYNNLEDIKIKNGSMQKPLCKRLYKFNRSIK